VVRHSVIALFYRPRIAYFLSSALHFDHSTTQSFALGYREERRPEFLTQTQQCEFNVAALTLLCSQDLAPFSTSKRPRSFAYLQSSATESTSTRLEDQGRSYASNPLSLGLESISDP
jgi:hypothetical protein